LVVGILFYTGYTAFTIPYNALAVEMTPDYKERTTLMAIRKMFHGGGEMLINTMPFLSLWLAAQVGRQDDQRFGFGVLGMVFGVLCAIAISVAFWGTRERKATEVAGTFSLWQSMTTTLRNRLFLRLTMALLALVLAIFTLATYAGYIFQFYLERTDLLAVTAAVGAVLGILVAPIWASISNRIGKPRAIVLAQSVIVIASISTYFCLNRMYPYLAFVYSTLYAIGWSGILVLVGALMADVIDLDELQTGERRECSYGGVYGFIFKLGIAGSGPVLGNGLKYIIGFDEALGASQTSETFLKLRLVTAVGSAVFAVIGLLLLLRFPLTAERAMEVRWQLEERRGKRGAIT
jgi:GPH family glycoside/pentoside/hexuronide:cation symporter